MNFDNNDYDLGTGSINDPGQTADATYGYQQDQSYAQGYGYQQNQSYAQGYGYQQDQSYAQGYGYQQDQMYAQGYGYQQDQVYAQGYGYQQDSAYAQGYGYQQDQMYAQGYGYQQDQVYAQGYGYQQDPAYAQNYAYQQDQSYAQNYAYQQDQVYAQNYVYQQDPAYAQGYGYQQGQMLNEQGQANNVGYAYQQNQNPLNTVLNQQQNNALQRIQKKQNIHYVADQEYESEEADEELSYEDERQTRRNRMMEEKRLQAKKRAYIKKLIPYIAIAAVAVIAIISVLIWGIVSIAKGSKKNNEPQEIEAEQNIDNEATEEEEVVEVQAKPQIANMLPTTVELPNMLEGYKVDASQASKAVSEEDVQSQFATIINATTGKVLATKNGGDRMNPASMTKVMTVLVASEHITDLEDTFEVTIEDTDFAYRNDLSCAGFGAGDVVPVKDLLYGAIMPSGGECCHALERYVADSEEEFIQMMNDKAAELGLTGTHFTNSAGFYNENHYTTLYDIAMIMKAAIENDICREVLHEHVYNTVAVTDHPEGLELSNWFMRRIEDKYQKTEVVGAKTGYVSQSGNCAVSYTIGNDGTVYICATGNAHSAWRAIFDHVSLYEQYVQ